MKVIVTDYTFESLDIEKAVLEPLGHKLAAHRCRDPDGLLAFDPAVPPAEMERAGCTPVGLDALLRQSDVLTLHCPSTPQTRRLIDRAALAKMKRGALLINVARGDVVETPALIDALRDGRLGGAGLDVCDPEPIPADSPLRGMANVILTPHVASASVPAVAAMRTTVAETVARALRGEPLTNVVNGVASRADQAKGG